MIRWLTGKNSRIEDLEFEVDTLHVGMERTCNELAILTETMEYLSEALIKRVVGYREMENRIAKLEKERASDTNNS